VPFDDAAAELPLSYAVTYTTSAADVGLGAETLLVAEPSTSPALRGAVLPAGSHSLAVYVLDAHGAATRLPLSAATRSCAWRFATARGRPTASC